MLTKYFPLQEVILKPSLRLALAMLKAQPKIKLSSLNRTERTSAACLRGSSASLSL